MTVSETTKPNAQQGFTLIELSIVLVIIGLIIGGILVGQDLIKAAEIRATVGQVEKYNSAINTFRSKYNGMPGDIPGTQALAFGLFQLTSPAAGLGDGNGLIEGGSAGALVAIGETMVFWRHLSDANLIDGSLGSSGNSVPVAATGVLTGNVTTVSNSLPASKTTPVNYFTVYAVTGLNYFQLIPISSITAVAGVYVAGTTGISPIQAYNMDIKLDDGLPQTGTVQSKAITIPLNGNPSAAVSSTANTCDMGNAAANATDTYNRVATTGGNDPSCSVRFRFN